MEAENSEEALTIDDVHEIWPLLSKEERIEAFRQLERTDAEEFFLNLESYHQAEIFLQLAEPERRSWLRLLPPDDAADLVQHIDELPIQAEILRLLDAPTREQVMALLAYAEDDAGGLMDPRFLRVRPDIKVDAALSYLRRQARERKEGTFYVYVLDESQRLLGVLHYHALFAAPVEATIRDLMETDLVVANEEMDQEELARLFQKHKFLAIPVVDSENRMKGIVTVDDIIDVLRQENTEDIQKIGAVEVLDMPYMQTPFFSMIRKRAGWLVFLFLGEMLTATAMGYFHGEIAQAVVLALFIPLIISSGGNCGSQASTLVVRALALGELQLRDWWRVFFRELMSGITLGLILGGIGLVRILLWPAKISLYGEHYAILGVAVAASVLGVVVWGTLIGSLLPFFFRRLGFDPASASAPFVATTVDVTGLIIYFSVANVVLRGTLL